MRAGAGVVEVRPGHELEFLRPLPVERLWGVGPVTLQRLQRLGVHRVSDLADLDERVLVTALGRAAGQQLARLARGHDDRPVEPHRDAKSIGHEETFPHDLHEPNELDRELVRLADAVASRLRQHATGARTLTLKVRFAGFETVTRSSTSAEPVDTAPAILAVVRPLLARIDPTPGVRLLGISGSNLGEPVEQLRLLDLPGADAPAGLSGTASRSAHEVAEAIDQIRDRFGTAAIGPASAVESGRLRLVRPGAQQWGPTDPDAVPPSEPDRRDDEPPASR